MKSAFAICVSALLVASLLAHAQDPPIASPPLTSAPDPAPPAPELMTFSQLMGYQKRLQQKSEQYLREHGWTYDGNTPGGFFLWELTYKDKQYRMRLDDALYVQRYIDDEIAQSELEAQLLKSATEAERLKLQSTGVQ